MPKQSRDSAMDHERMLRMLADSVPQIICTAGPNGKIDYFNRRWFEFTPVWVKHRRLQTRLAAGVSSRRPGPPSKPDGRAAARDGSGLFG